MVTSRMRNPIFSQRPEPQGSSSQINLRYVIRLRLHARACARSALFLRSLIDSIVIVVIRAADQKIHRQAILGRLWLYSDYRPLRGIVRSLHAFVNSRWPVTLWS